MRSVVFFVTTSLMWAASAAAQSIGPSTVFGVYQQLNWQERDGLPLDTVIAVTPTRDGYLWLGTYGGAARFDGVRFTLFNPSNTTGIRSAVVSSILQARNGDVWLSTFGGGVSRLSNGRFTAYGVKEGLSSDYVKTMLEDRAGTIWIATDGGGVNSFRDGHFTAYTVGNGLPGNFVRALLEDADGSLLVGTNAGIARITGGRVRPYAGPATAIQALARARDGAIWAAGIKEGLYRIDAGGVTTFGPAQGLTNTTVESLCADDAGAMWVGNLEGALFRYAGGRFETYTPADGLPGSRVAAIACNADKGAWLGTDGGLVRLKLPRFTVYTKRDGLANDFVGNIFQDADGSVWIGSSDGLTRFKDGVFKIFTTREGLPDDHVNGLARGTDGFPLVRTRTGLSRWRHDRFVPVDGLGDVPWDRVATILQDHTGTLWISVPDLGLLRVRDGHITRLTTRDGLADDNVVSLFEDRDGRIWVGTIENGVTVIDHEHVRSFSTRDGLPASHVKVFYQDATGTIWIGTHGGGLCRFTHGTFVTISARQGLYNDYIFQILDDGDGNLWMNCNAGIWRASLTQLNEAADGRRTHIDSVGYGTADGMPSSEGVGGTLAGWKMRDGSLWFPTIKGIVAIDPRRRDMAPPRVVIEGLTIDREPVAAGAAVRLTPGQENLEIEYTGLSWSRPQAIKFRYRLIGLDRDWINAGARRTAYYSHLAPGSYTFVVTADNGEGVWNDTGQRLAVVVLPRFYQTWWFVLAAVSSLAALVWLSWRYRVAQLEATQAAQLAFSRQLIASQERERQRIAAELHDSLGQSLLVVKNRAMLGTLTQPNEQALKHFQEIGTTVAQTLDEVRTISYNLRPHHLDQLGLTTTLGAMIEKMAESATIRITSHLDDIDGAFAPADEITIYRIIQESLNNVVKHAHATEAQVTVRCLEHHVELVIRDNGRGFTSDGAQSAVGGASGDRRGGFGLKGLAQRVDMLGGTHTIASVPGLGTTVTVRIGLDTHAAAREQT